MGLTDLCAILPQEFSFDPALHVRYRKKTVSITDGLPKFQDLPEEFGGSGDLISD